MKRLILLLALPVLHGAKGYCQSEVALPDATLTPASSFQLRSNNEVTPRWTVEANFRYGQSKQAIETHDLAQSYRGSLGTSRYSGLDFSGESSFGGDLSLSYYFNRKHTLGVGIGAMFMQNRGTLTMDGLRADYQDQDAQGRIYRQIITSNGPIAEAVTIQTLGVPVLFKFKNQFKKKFGIWADVGPVFGIYNNTKTTLASTTFNYEAIYRLSGEVTSVVSGFDESASGNPVNSLILTEAHYASNSSISAAEYLDLMRNTSGYNVGLAQRLSQNESTPEKKYDKISLGGIVQAGISWEVAYRMSFQLGGYFMFNRYENSGGEGNHISDRIVSEGAGTASNYYGLSNVIKNSDYRSYGAMAGVRIFIGGKGRDVDGDGYVDDIDGCRSEYGTVNGCPDNDGDGIPNDEDECQDIAGLSITRGCPDTDGDGFPDITDSCLTVPGTIQGCPAEHWANVTRPDTTLIAPNGLIMAPHIVLETDVLLFPFAKNTLEPEALKVLDNAANTLAKEPKVVIHISGHTDDVGTYANNLVRSMERAKAAKAYLMERGVAENRIIIAGLGKDNPVTTNDSEENRAKNRRIELRLLLPVE